MLRRHWAGAVLTAAVLHVGPPAGAEIFVASDTAVRVFADSGVAGFDVAFTSAAATPQAVEALLEALRYTNSSVTPAVSRTLAISINDGDGDFSAPVDLVVQIDP